MTAPYLLQSATRTAPHAAHSILCVDADDFARLLLAELLYEYEVDFALTADDAVQLAHSRTYALCFMDPAVPGFRDLDLIEEVRAYEPQMPIVICSATEVPLSAQVQGRLLKPICPSAARELALCVLRRCRYGVGGM